MDENGFHDIGSPDFSTDIKDGLKNDKVIVSVCGGLETTSEKLFETDTKVVATSKQLYDYTEKLGPRETQITIEEVSRLRSVENSNYFKELSDLKILLIYYPKKVTFNSKDNLWYRTSVIENIVQWTYDADNDTYVKILQRKLGNDNLVINNDTTNTIYQVKLDFDKALFSDEEAYYNLRHAIENESYQKFYNNAILFPTKEDKELLQKYEKDLVKAKKHRKETKLLLLSRFQELEKEKEKRHREKHAARDRENAIRLELEAAAAIEQARLETQRAQVEARRLVNQAARELQQAQSDVQEAQDRQLSPEEAEDARNALEQKTEQSEIAIRAAEAANAAKAAQQEADAAILRERAAYDAEKEAERKAAEAKANANAPPSNGLLAAFTGALSSLIQGSPEAQLKTAKQDEISATEEANRATAIRIAAEEQAVAAASNAQTVVAKAQELTAQSVIASAQPQTLNVPVSTSLKLPPTPQKRSTRKRTYSKSKTYSKTRKAHTRSHTRSHTRAHTRTHARKRSVSRKRSPSPSRKSKYKSKSRKRAMSKRKRSPTHLKGRTSPQRHSPLVPPPVRPRA